MRKRLQLGLFVAVVATMTISLYGVNAARHREQATNKNPPARTVAISDMGAGRMKTRAQNATARFSHLNKVANENALTCVVHAGITVPSSARVMATGALLRGGVSFASQADIDDRRINGYRTWMTSKERETSISSQSTDSAVFAIAMNGESVADMYHASNGMVVASTGCLPDARVAVFGSLENFAQIQSIFDSLAGQVQGEILSSQEMLTTQKDWSACMAKSGHAITSWFEMSELLRKVIDYKNDPVNVVKKKDKMIARADADCLDDVGYVANMSSVPDNAEDNVLLHRPDLIVNLEDKLGSIS